MAYTVLDVSKYNPIEDYTAAAKCVDGILIRVGYRGYSSSGTLTKDTYFDTHYNGFAASGKPIGVYWFTQATTEAEAVEEANYVYSIIKNLRINFPVYIDSEYSNENHDGRADSLSQANRTACVVAFCERMIALGYRTGIYASDSWFISQLNYDTIAEKTSYSIWDASYSAEPSRVPTYDAWQYTSSGSIDGYSGRVDLSHFYKDVAGWEKEPTDISGLNFGLSRTTAIYCATEINPDVTVKDGDTILVKDTDYTVSYLNNINVGTATVTVTGIGVYTGTKQLTFDITALSISSATVTCGTADSNGYYNLSNLSVKVGTITLSSSDYTTSVKTTEEDKKVKSTVTITGKGNFNDTTSATFITGIVKDTTIDINTLNFSTGQSSVAYNRSPQKIEITIKNGDTVLVENTDYTLTYSDNTNAGTAKVVVTGKGDIYYGTKEIYFSITRLDISSGILSCGSPDSEGYYDPNNTTVSVASTILKKDIEFTYSVFSRHNGLYMEAVITAEGVGNYTGKLQETYKTGRYYIDINTAEISLSDSALYYTGNENIPEIITELVEDTDFVVEKPKESINCGEYNIIVTGKGAYSGIKILNYTIDALPLYNAVVTFGEADAEGCYQVSNMEVSINDCIIKYQKDYLYTSTDENIDNGYIKTTIFITGINNYSGSKTVSIITSRRETYQGKMVELEKVSIFPRYCSTRAESNKTGTYYLWDDIVKNGKIRITNNASNVGKPGFITGWVNRDDLINNDDIKIGDKVLVSGTMNTYADGSGNNISKKNSIMFVVDILDSVQFTYCYGLATALNRARQGWANLEIIKKVTD